MGNSRVKTFSYGEEDDKVVEELEKIAKREKRSVSYILVEAAKEYAKAHGEGNDSYPLEEFAKGLVAYPTAWSKFDDKRLRSLTDEEIVEMTDALLDRQKQLSEEVRRRYPQLSGYRAFRAFKKGEGIDTGKAR